MDKQIKNNFDNKTKVFVMQASVNYFYELGPYIVEKYSLETSIAEINRVIEMMISSTLENDNIDLSKFYHIACLEFNYYNKMKEYLEDNIHKLIEQIDCQDDINTANLMNRLNESFLLIDPSFKNTSKLWHSLTWPDTKLYKKDFILLDDTDIEIDKLDDLLPEDVFETVIDYTSISLKKDELINTLELLKEIKSDLENIVLNLLPKSIIEN